MTNLASVCAFGLVCGLWANIALGSAGSAAAQAHCIGQARDAARRASSPPADAHLAALLHAHALTAIELGGAGLAPMRWGERGATRLAPNPIARSSAAASISHSDKGCTS